ncbi:MAG: hypothetical protein PF503_05085 [Desulfobacula sp.]|jgi:hypothetical protein|nr:hypothetical protein [Desulfobacula sp.]
MYTNDQEFTSLRFIKELFHHFSMGYHLSIDDGELWAELNACEDQYRDLFNSLGYPLCNGSTGVYYFEPGKERVSVNTVSKKFTLFMAVLYDSLADQGKDPVSAITEDHFLVKDLPHLKVDQYRQIMEKVNIKHESDLIKVLNRLQKYGFLELRDNYLIMFKKSVSRFTELFAEFVEPLKSEYLVEGESNDV